jgi:outer membrane receptor protein involved in Fe transport
LGKFEFGSALQLGYERSQIDQGLQVHAARIGPRVWAQWRGADGLRLRLGADYFGTVGSLHAPLDQDDAFVEIRVPIYADVAARSVSGAYGELTLPLLSKLRLDVGVRADAWLTGSRLEAAVDPRVTLTFRSHDNVAWHVAGGTGHQPAVFLIPLPGIADVGLDHGLQSSLQSEAGVAIDLPAELRLESQVYLQHLNNMILPDLVLEQSDDCNALPTRVADMTLRCSQGYPRASAWAYGLEVFLRRSVTEALSGWLSYTLGWARATSVQGMPFTPSFDVRHVLNLVLQYRFGGGFSTGLRLQYRSGKDASATFVRATPIRYEQRLPGFFRADLQLSYSWRTFWGRLRVSLEWFNVTIAREATDIQCKDGVATGTDPLTATPCAITRAPALFFPNLGVRAEF